MDEIGSILVMYIVGWGLFLFLLKAHENLLKDTRDMVKRLEERVDSFEAIMNSDSIDKPTLVKTGTVTTESIKIRVRSI